MEAWEDIAGYGGNYRVSNMGRVKKMVRRVKVLKPVNNGRGYMIVTLYSKGALKNHLVHRLVATAFIANQGDKPQVNHKNGIRSDNRADNLEWVTQAENMSHRTRFLRNKQV